MRMPMIPVLWRTSLFFRLSLILGASITAFWLLISSIFMLYDLRKTSNEHLNHFLSQMNTLTMSLENALQENAIDVRTLLNTWQSLSNDPESSLAREDHSREHYLTARYVPFNAQHSDDAEQVAFAMDFIEAFGSGGLGNIDDTFAVLDYGVAISSGGKSYLSGSNHIKQLMALREISERGGIIWGKPYRNEEGEWQLIVAIREPRTGVILGITTHLISPFGKSDTLKVPSGTLIWLSAEGESLNSALFWFQEQQMGLAACKQKGFVRHNREFIACQELKPVGWYVLLLIPAGELSKGVSNVFYRNLVMTIVSLISLVCILYLTLQYSLGRTLKSVALTLMPQSALNELQPLPMKSEDELGQIANAYNRLLDTVKTQYAGLEAKVQERTVALNEARLRAEQANARKSEQINNISHEIRTPLNGIAGALTLLGRTHCDVEQRDLVNTALRCSEHLLEIINNLLDFSRIESGQMVVNTSLLEVLPLIDQSMLTVHTLAMEKNLTLRCQLEASFPLKICTDGLRLRQILINLLNNAVKFTASGEVILRAWGEAERICFRVRDNGPGIPTEHFENIFAPFLQLGHHIAGSGLGLPISRSLARMLGGDLFFEEVPAGASFRLELPLEGAIKLDIYEMGPIVAPEQLHEQLRAWGFNPELGENPDLMAPDLAFLPGRLQSCLNGKINGEYVNIHGEDISVSPWSLKVLLVDDVDTNRDIVGRMLRQQGHLVYTTSSGAQALELGRTHIFDLVLMDILMPSLSGREALLLWRIASSGVLDPGCPIVALTATTQPGERERLLEDGFDEYITKPVSAKMLSSVLEFAADLQLDRGIELEPGTLIGQADVKFELSVRRRLHEDLSHYISQLEKALSQGNKTRSREVLHTLKGLTGQSGLSQASKVIEEWEVQLRGGYLLDVAEVKAVLSHLLETECVSVDLS